MDLKLSGGDASADERSAIDAHRRRSREGS